MSNETDQAEHARQVRQQQLVILDGLIARVMKPTQLFVICLVDDLGAGGWAASSNAASPVLLRILETILAERQGLVDTASEPSIDTIKKLHAQYRKLDVQPTEVVRRQLRTSLDAIAQAVLKDDSIGEATLLLYLAGCAMVLYRRAVLAFIEARKAKGGTS